MNLYEKLNRLDDSLVESKRVVKKKKLTESVEDDKKKLFDAAASVKCKIDHDTIEYAMYDVDDFIENELVYCGKLLLSECPEMLFWRYVSDENFGSYCAVYESDEEFPDAFYQISHDRVYDITDEVNGDYDYDDDIDEKLSESLASNEYELIYHKNSAALNRRKETIDDVYDDWTTSIFRANSDLDAWKEAFERVKGEDYTDYLSQDVQESDFVEYFEESDWGDGSPILIKLSSSDSDLYDTGYTLESWIDEFVEQDYDDNIYEMLTEGNNVSSQLPPAIDDFLQDIAQMYGTITYKDIVQHEYTEEDLKKLKNYRRRFMAEIAYEGDEEADEMLKKIANSVAQIVKSENILESRNNPYFAPYGHRDAAKVLNGKAPEYYYHLKEIEMDRGDGVKLARYAMKKGLPVMVDKNSDPDYPEFAIKGEYHWNDYFYPYPTAHEDDLVAWDGKMFVEDQLTEAIDPTKAKEMRDNSDADVVFYGYQHKNDKPVEVGPEEMSYPEFEITKNQIIHSFDKLSQNSSRANRYGKEHDIMFYALYNRKSK